MESAPVVASTSASKSASKSASTSASKSASKSGQGYMVIGAICIIIIAIVIWYQSSNKTPSGTPNGPPNGPPSGSCNTNTDCGNEVCNPLSKTCVACDTVSNLCPSPQVCTNGTCGSSGSGGGNGGCATNCGAQVCSSATNTCVPCDTTSNLCQSPLVCVSGVCQNTCTDSSQCMGQVCSSGKCVACDASTNKCPTGMTCNNGTCGTPSTGPRKAIFYHQQWDTYGGTANDGSVLPGSVDASGANIATAGGRNFQIADIPDDVTDIAYAFWWVDALGNVGSGDDAADHEKPVPPNFWPDASVLQQNMQPFMKSPNYTNFQYPVTRGSVGDDKNSPKNFGNLGAIIALNAARVSRGKPKLNVSLTIGGWTYSVYFSDAVKPANQQNFVNSCIAALTTWSDVFNGLNFDWEYITDNGANWGSLGNPVTNQWGTFMTPPNHTDPSDVDNFASFLYQLRQGLSKAGLTGIKIGIPVTPAPEKAQFDINKLHPLVDEIHIMTYDLHSGAFDYLTGFHSNPYAVGTASTMATPNSLKGPWGGSNTINLLPPTSLNYPSPAYSTEEIVRYYLGLGGQVSDDPNQPGYVNPGPGNPKMLVPLPNVPSSKLFIGVAFYSRGFANSGGVYNPSACIPYTGCTVNGLPNAIYAPGDSNSIPYNQIVTLCGANGANGTGNWGPIVNDDASGGGTMAAYCYNKTDQLFLSFDNQASIAEKMKIVKAYNLGGVLAWDNASDIRSVNPTNKTSLPSSLTYAITSSLAN